MSEGEFERRRGLSFLQAEGREPLPRLLSGADLTPRFRSRAYAIIASAVAYNHGYNSGPSSNALHLWGDYFGKYIDEIPYSEDHFFRVIKSYISVNERLLDLLQYCARTKLINMAQYDYIKDSLAADLIGFRFVGEYVRGDVTLMPVADEDEAQANSADYSEIRSFPKSQEHFLQAVEELKSSHFRGSVAESISGVESIIKTLTGKSSVTLGDGIKLLAKESDMNAALKAGLEKLYGWTNSPDGMRHALSDESKDVTEAEARFMLSACLAFAAWLKRSFPDGK
jgi:hypothetical protein